MSARIVAVLAALLAILPVAEAAAREVVIPKDRTLYIQFEQSGTLFNDAAEQSNIAGGFGYGARLGWRATKWGAFFEFQRDFWMVSEFDLAMENGVLNFALGVERLSFKGRLRTSLSFGTSTLMFNTLLDERGTTGIFADLRPACLRWPVHPRVVIELAPITFTLLAPVLGDPGIRKIEYRTILTVEVSL